jgi:hypothetical protein
MKDCMGLVVKALVFSAIILATYVMIVWGTCEFRKMSGDALVSVEINQQTWLIIGMIGLALFAKVFQKYAERGVDNKYIKAEIRPGSPTVNSNVNKI